MSQVLFGRIGDSLGVVYRFWEGLSSGWYLAPRQPLPELYNFAVRPFLSPLWSYNLLIILGTVGSVYAMFLLLRHMGNNRFLSLAGGLIYAVMVGRQFQAYDHAGLADWFWYPLFWLAILKLGKIPKWWRGVLVGLVAFLALTDSYYNLLLLIPIAFVGLVWLAVEWRHRIYNWLNVLWASLVFTAGTILLSWKLLFDQGPVSTEAVRPSTELRYYSAHWWSYLLPSVDHPFLGKFILSFVRGQLDKGNLIEQSQFLTWTMVLTVLITGVIFLRRRSKIKSVPSEIWMAVSIFVLAVIFSIAPSREIFGLTVNFPAHYFYQVLPMFRVYARFGFIVATALVIVFIYVLSKLSRWLQIMLIILTLFECWWTVPTTKLTPPIAETRLAALPAGMVMDFPFIPTDEVLSSEYLYWQTINRHQSLDADASVWHPTIFYALNSTLFQKLIGYRPKYVLLHKDIYQKGRLPAGLDKYYDPSYSLFPPLWRQAPKASWLISAGYHLIYSDKQSDLWEENKNS